MRTEEESFLNAHRQIISRIPLRGMTPEEWGTVIQNELIKIWTDAMPQSDIDKFLAVWPCPMDSVPPRLFVRLDSIILHQAQTLGWRLTLSELVRFRMAQWDRQNNGPELFRKFGLAMARSARIMQRKELPPIEDPDAWAVKRETVVELRRILKIMRAHFSTKRTRPGQAEVVDFFSARVSDPALAFLHLYANLDRWLNFFEYNPEAVRPILFASKPSPAAFYDEFLAASTGWKPEALRQGISQLRP